MRTKGFMLVAALAAALAVGVAAAAAHGGPGRGGPGPGHRGGIGGGSLSSLVTQAAKELSVTRAKLVASIQDAAAARVEAAVDDGDLPSGRADDLKAEAQDNLSFAYGLSETKTVAGKLGITTSALNTGFRAARKTLATAQIEPALEDGRITSSQAGELKAKLTNANLPGYKGGGFPGGFGFGRR